MRKPLSIAALALVVCLTLMVAGDSVPPPSTSILQAAVNAYASIGLAASCATYVTQNQGGTLVNNACRVGDQWVDADLTVQMTSEQLRAGYNSGPGGSMPELFSSSLDPSTMQVTPTISTPTMTQHTPITRDQVASSTSSTKDEVNKGLIGATLACDAAGALNSFFLGGIATEVTQLCNFTALAAQYAVQGRHFDVFAASLQPLGNRGRFATSSLQLGSPAVVDIHGEAAPIARVVNGYGGDPYAAWSAVTVRMNAPYLQSEQPGSAHLSSAASVNLVDAFGTDAVRTAGYMRRHQANTLSAVQALQQQSAALDSSANTPVAQQNITNAALMQVINNEATSQSAQVAVLEQLVIANTWQRNAAASAANNYAHQLGARSAKTADLSGLSSAVQYRMP